MKYFCPVVGSRDMICYLSFPYHMSASGWYLKIDRMHTLPIPTVQTTFELYYHNDD